METNKSSLLNKLAAASKQLSQPQSPQPPKLDVPSFPQEAAIAPTSTTPSQEDIRSELLKPSLLSRLHVLFSSVRSNFGASTPSGIIRFKDGYAQTDDAETIDYLRENAEHFNITEVAP